METHLGTYPWQAFVHGVLQATSGRDYLFHLIQPCEPTEQLEEDNTWIVALKPSKILSSDNEISIDVLVKWVICVGILGIDIQEWRGIRFVWKSRMWHSSSLSLFHTLFFFLLYYFVIIQLLAKKVQKGFRVRGSAPSHSVCWTTILEAKCLVVWWPCSPNWNFYLKHELNPCQRAK